MASIFTFDEASRDSVSPWATPKTTPNLGVPQPGLLADYGGIVRLPPEKDDGAVEYKLHLLIRPRRKRASSPTGSTGSESHRSSQQTLHQSSFYDKVLATSNQSRQTRLQQLTTQLLWRLQQSSPYHASRVSQILDAKLPVAGLEESRGALYEIGVQDDGEIVGLTKDELQESIETLRFMASTLGCTISVLRMVKCKDTDIESQQLYVAEALVLPDLTFGRRLDTHVTAVRHIPGSNEANVYQTGRETKDLYHRDLEATEQLRISFTGPSASGKTSLIGCCSQSILDNGRGKSRTSLLKHRHELATGITSSLGQELWAYKGLEVRNYASGNVSSWTDCHASASRLVFAVDSPGSLKQRRTIIRASIGWDPHWNLVCIAAANDTGNIGLRAGMEGHADFDPAKAHLDFCLMLNKPLVIVVTKLDVADRASLRDTLSRVLSSVKAAGRVPTIIRPDSKTTTSPLNLLHIQQEEDHMIKAVFEGINEQRTSIVPIILTSTVDGRGLGSLHALLRNLPLPKSPSAQDLIGPALNPEQPQALFHIEDVFSLPASRKTLATGEASLDLGVVISGRLRFGRISVSDRVVIGPFEADLDGSVGRPSIKAEVPSSPRSYGASIPLTSTPESARYEARTFPAKGEFPSARVLSIRNLRLPVRTLYADQVGTIGVVFDVPDEPFSSTPFEKQAYAAPRIRKGQILAIPNQYMGQTRCSLQAASGFTASFEDSDINSVNPGSLAVVYIASVRASARVLRLTPQAKSGTGVTDTETLYDVFGRHDKLDDEEEEPVVFGSDGVTEVTFEFLHSQWIELGCPALVMPGGGQGLYSGSERGEKGIAGLDGFIGKVIEIIE